MKGSLVIVGFFLLGVVCGLGHVFPVDLSQTDISFYALCALMCCVGIGLGSDPQTLRNFRSLSPRLALLPAGTILGTLAGALVVSLCLAHRSAGDCLAVGATVALLANITREILTLLLAPLLARWFGPLAPIAAGGATTMDTTLPIIVQASGQRFVIVSIFHGFLVDFSVPFLVTLFCGL